MLLNVMFEEYNIKWKWKIENKIREEVFFTLT